MKKMRGCGECRWRRDDDGDVDNIGLLLLRGLFE